MPGKAARPAHISLSGGLIRSQRSPVISLGGESLHRPGPPRRENVLVERAVDDVNAAIGLGTGDRRRQVRSRFHPVARRAEGCRKRDKIRVIDLGSDVAAPENVFL